MFYYEANKTKSTKKISSECSHTSIFSWPSDYFLSIYKSGITMAEIVNAFRLLTQVIRILFKKVVQIFLFTGNRCEHSFSEASQTLYYLFISFIKLVGRQCCSLVLTYILEISGMVWNVFMSTYSWLICCFPFTY